MRADLPGPEWETLIEGCEISAWRWEQQPTYQSDLDTGCPDRWRSGDLTPPEYMTGFAKSFLVDYFASGRTRERVRLVDNPPSWFQEWSDWAADIHRGVGEDIHQMNRTEAEALDVIGDPLVDWWLIDDRFALLMRFDPVGNLLQVDLDDSEAMISHCRRVRDITMKEVSALR